MNESPSRFKALVSQAKQQIKEVTVADVQSRLERGEKLQLVDVREQSEWNEGHLPEATHLSKGVIERDIEKQFPAVDTELILYCGGGSRSALAADSLRQMGYTNVLSMVGGFRDWQQAGYPVDVDIPW